MARNKETKGSMKYLHDVIEQYRRYKFLKHGEMIEKLYALIDEIWDTHKLKPCIVNVVPPYDEYKEQLYKMVWDSESVVKARIFYRGARKLLKRKANITLPLLPKKHTCVKDQWTIVMHLPGRISHDEFTSYFEKFQDRLGGAILIEKKNNVTILTVMTMPLKNMYGFEFNPESYKDMFLPIPIGYTPRGLMVKDLAKVQGIMVAGFKGSGKSKFIHNLIVGLYMARDIDVMVIDLKQGVEFSYVKKTGIGKVAVRIEEANALLKEIIAHMNKVYDKLVKADCDSITSYIEMGYSDIKFMVVVIDEIGEIGKDKECVEMLDSLVKLSRAAGIYIIGGTQRPAADLYTGFSSTRSQFPASVCFAVLRKEESYMMLGDGNDRGCRLDFDRPGRGIWKWDIEIEFQSMCLSVPKEPAMLVKSVYNERMGGIVPNDKPRIMLPAR